MTKNLKIALIALIFLLIIFFINNNKQNSFISKSNKIFTKNINEIKKILIQQNNEAIELTRIDTTWEISGNDSLIIKDRAIDNFFNQVLKINTGTLISENPKKYNKYSISDSLGIHLELINAQNKTIAYYVFGKSKTDYSRSYVRLGDDPNVYLADQNITYMLNTSESYWGEIPKLNIETPENLETPE